jgi:hypothetical protein
MKLPIWPVAPIEEATQVLMVVPSKPVSSFCSFKLPRTTLLAKWGLGEYSHCTAVRDPSLSYHQPGEGPLQAHGLRMLAEATR